jgi:putative alpha-1,2-mannosidase
MASLTITAADVGFSSDNLAVPTIKALAAMNQGVPFYVDNDGKAVPADVDTAAKAAVKGISMTPATAANDTIAYMPLDTASAQGKTFYPGGTLVANRLYYLTGTGTIGEFADLSSTEYITPLFRAVDTEIARVESQATGLQVA